MAKTPIALVIATALILAAWLRLETRAPERTDVILIVALALLPAVVMLVRRSWLLTAGTVAAATFVAVSIAFDIPLTNLRPGDDEREFFGPFTSQFEQGFLEFYETRLPFDRFEWPLMHSVVLLAIFGFLTASAVLLAAGLPLAGGLVMIAGIGWASTIMPGERPLLSGTLLLLGILAILFLIRDERRRSRGLGLATGVALMVGALAVGIASSDAVAKSAFLNWRDWDPYNVPDDPVSVRYVWNSHYQGIEFPDDPTVVLRVRTPDNERQLYWRATALDEYTGVGWRESFDPQALGLSTSVEFLDDPLLPAAALDEDNWVRQEVTVEALTDNHLIASAQPVRIEIPNAVGISRDRGIVFLSEDLEQGQTYVAWSYVPEAKPSELGAALATYPDELDPFLQALPGLQVPDWGADNRRRRVEGIFEAESADPLVASHKQLYDLALEVVGDAESPYLAALAIEAWFREEGGFSYEEQPPTDTEGLPPLVAFCIRSQQGYCQHYAGAMALMLRLLGVPSRVAAGFTSGERIEARDEWVVTDHNGHTWVEVYFPGHGWIPFDPTPGRGELTAAYSAVSESFDAQDALSSLQTATASSATLFALRREAEGLSGLAEDAAFGPGGSGGPGSSLAQGDGIPDAVIWLLVGLAVIIGAIPSTKYVRRRLRFATRDDRALASACRRDLEGYLADQRVPISEASTLQDLGKTLEQEFTVGAGPFVRSVSLARYGPPDRSAEAARRSRHELRVLRRDLRRSLSLRRRVRGTLSTRSLRV